MADKKISELTALTGANVATDDQLVIVDTSAALTKSITIDEFKNALDTATGFVRITGDTMTGNLSMSGANITLGDSSGVSDDRIVLGDDSDLLIYHNNPNSFIRDQGNGNFFITTDGNYIFLAKDDLTNMATFQVDGPVELYHSGSPKLSTSSTGISVTGNATFADNGKAIFGAGSDLQIYHDGSHSYIRDVGTGLMRLTAQDFLVEGSDGSDIIYGVQGGATTVYHAGAPKLATTSTGIDVTGTVTADGLTVDGSSTIDSLSLTANTTFPTTGLTLHTNGFSYEMTGSQGKIFRDSGNNKALMQITTDNDISFFEDTGTTPKLFWDASAESLGLGITAPEAAIHIIAPANQEPMTIEALTNGYNYITHRNAAGTDVAYTGLGGGAALVSGAVTDYGIRATGNLLLGAGSNTERMRIDSSGNVIVGGTSAGEDGAVTLSNTGYIQARIDNDTVAYFDRTGAGDDGEVIRIQQNGTTVGSIGSNAGRLVIHGTNTGIRFAGSELMPTNGSGVTTDNAVDVGHTTYRFKDLYLSGGVKFDGVTQLSGAGAYFKGQATHGVRFNDSTDSFNNFVIREDGTSWTRNGIYFGTPNASSPNAQNLLDDYEEGAFTPASGVSLTVNYAKYTKIGRLVYINVDYSVGSTSSGSAFYNTLPFTPSDAYSAGSFNYQTTTYDNATVNIESTGVYFRNEPDTGNMTYAQASGRRFIYSGWYHTNS